MSGSNPTLRLRAPTSRDEPSHGTHAEAGQGVGPSTSSVARILDAPVEDQARFLRALSEHCTEGIVVCDLDQQILFVNPSFERVTGYTMQEVVGRTPRILRSGQQGADFYARMWSQILATGHWRGEICNRRKNGELYIEWLSIAAVSNSAGLTTHYIGVFADLTQRKHAEDTAHHFANFDGLTQLPNRLLLSERLSELLIAASAARKRVALLLIDLDRFKNINDSMGHDAGDLLLQTMGRRLSRSIRRGDIVARLGGDEFAVALPEINDATDADFVAQKLLTEIARPLSLGGREIEIHGSVGICLYPDHAQTVTEMISNADTAMYQAKQLGRGRRQFYTRAMSQQARDRLDLESALRRALRQDQFELYYQPQMDLRSGDVLTLEALIRWNRPGVGLVMPGEFIALAEERGLIAEIGEWAIGAAADQVVAWDREGLAPFGIALNVSASQFHCGDFVERIQRALRRRSVSTRRIELEITESVIMLDSEATVEILQRLHDLGVSLSIDDFGTGYSSLSYLRRFPLDEIKIDRSFVKEMTSDDGAAGIVRGIIELARSLKLQVVAEGVETSEQLKRLIDLRCDRAQGFLLGRPVPAAQIGSFLDEWPKRWRTLTG